MLGKLLKYDMKIQMKLLGAAYAVVALIAMIAAVFELLKRNFTDILVVDIANMLTRGITLIAVVVMVAGTFIYAVLRFRKNLFKDEGYLMHTLPVREWQLYVSKLLSGIMCCVISFLAALAAVCLAFVRVPDISLIISEISQSGMPAWVVPMTITVIVLTVPATLIQFYAALVFGYTIKTRGASPVNKDLMSVVSYIVLYMVQQVISLGSILVWGIIDMDNVMGKLTAIDGTAAGYHPGLSLKESVSVLGGIYGLAIGLSLTIATGLAILSVWRMEKHLDLN